MPEIAHEFVQANGLRFHVAKAGAGPLMLFLHGFPEFWRAWRTPMAHFAARGWLAAAPDQRGYNLSDKPPAIEAYRARHLVEDLRQLAAVLTKDRFVLVAHDWGGAVAWSLAISHPELISRLVILNSPHPYTFWRELARNPVQQKASEYMLSLRSPKAEQKLSENEFDRLWRFAFELGNPGFGDADRKAYLEAWSQPGALTGGLNWYRASPLYPPSEADAGAAKLSLDARDFVVRVPTLVIWGLEDAALRPALLEGLEACVPDLRVVRVPGASHWIVHERPELVCGEIERFVGAPPV